MSSFISNQTALRKRRFRIASVLVFLAVMVYAWFTMESIWGNGPDIFPGVLHPVEFTLVVTFAFSALLIGYLSFCSIILRKGFTRSSTGKFIALAGTMALIWTLQEWVADFVVSDGYINELGYKALQLTFVLPHDLVSIVRDPAYFDLLPEFAVALALLLLLGGVFTLSKYMEGLGMRMLGAIGLFYLGFLASGLSTSGSTSNELLWIVASAVIAIGMVIVVEILIARLAHVQSTGESRMPFRSIIKDSLLVGVWGFLGAIVWKGYPAPPISLPLVLLVVSVAAATGLVTALVVFALSRDQQPATPIQEVQPVLPRRRIIIS